MFTAVVDQDVMDANGSIAIPKGSNAELMVKNASSKDLTLDLESVSVGGQRYAVTADASGLHHHAVAFVQHPVIGGIDRLAV